MEQQKIVMWETLSQFILPEIQRVVEFAKRIANFTELMQEDQLVLIKTGFFEVWLVRMTRMFNRQSFTLTFSDGSYLTREQLELIYNLDLVTMMFAFAEGFSNLHLNDGEIGLFTAVVLLTS
uniref:NR LBD domain-containing protein n=1 Tax=Romanomermis culicivorax TaxID=13658 RepID=A0A915KLL8_ROMCU